MIGTLFGLIFLIIIAGFIWWAVVGKLFPLIAPYIGEPFMTLGFAGIHVGGPFGGRWS